MDAPRIWSLPSSESASQPTDVALTPDREYRVSASPYDRSGDWTGVARRVDRTSWDWERDRPAAVPVAADVLPDVRGFSLAWSRPGAGVAIASASLLTYLLAAVVIVLVAHSIIGDAWSRVANAYYVLFSRDPHLAAIGFVWNPLPSLAVMPLLPLKFIWPDMAATGFAGCIVSALCMAASVWVVYAIALDWQVRRWAAIAVTLLFAFNPMIVYYGANGMSEAMFILTMLLTVRYLARWSRDRQIGSLVLAGIAMAAAYMTRYEAAVAAVASVLSVVIVSSWSGHGSWRDRLEEGLADAIVFLTPFAATFVAWAIASWLIVGNPFEQFTSVYGVVSQLNVAQTAVAQYTGQGTSAAYVWSARQLLGLEPGLILAAMLGLVVTFRGRHGLTIPAVAVLGGSRVLGRLRFHYRQDPGLAALFDRRDPAGHPPRPGRPCPQAVRGSPVQGSSQGLRACVDASTLASAPGRPASRTPGSRHGERRSDARGRRPGPADRPDHDAQPGRQPALRR